MKPILPGKLLSTSALHRQGTMVTLAGKTAYLPNNDMLEELGGVRLLPKGEEESVMFKVYSL